MSIWDMYQSRLEAKGSNMREVRLNREREYISRKISNSLSFHHVLLNGEEFDLSIVNTENPTVKTICSMPGESFDSGSLVEWMDSYWLVTEIDFNNEVYTKAAMVQCNHVLRWIASDESIVERWCVVVDGTRYLTGETNSSYNDNGVVLGDTRISVCLPRDEYTVQLNRDYRFLIDDPDSISVLAYRITKPFKVGQVYSGKGVVTFIMTEVNTEDDDNMELRIADYYKHFERDPASSEVGGTDGVDPAPPSDASSIDVSDEADIGKKVWL